MCYILIGRRIQIFYTILISETANIWYLGRVYWDCFLELIVSFKFQYKRFYFWTQKGWGNMIFF